MLNFHNYELYKGIFSNPFTELDWMKTVSPTSGGEGGPGKGKLQSLKGIVAGGITGAIEICITYPTEYVKTQLQLDSKGGAKKYTGSIDCVKKTVKEHGFFGLYRGLAVLVYGAIPKVACRFGAFETFKGMVADERGQLSPHARVFCGLGAGISEAVFAVTPMETIKTKFINDRRSDKPRFKSFIHGVGVILREQGLSGIYQGVVPTVLKQGSNQAIRFYCMETLKDLYRGGDPTVHVPKPMVGLMGAIAGAASVVGNTPIDVVKTRLQGLDAKKYNGTIDCIVKMWKEEGFASFYKGTLPRLARVCMDVAITFMVYDSFMELFNKLWP
ncbi:hypothetical protein O3M35_003176 [Rhynocoris fuscipes]|uniref:Citrate transport protein n=1 Tax=Rhynocoris fuscipes TaxID=488301 RepID=A0AAW1CKI9_9HEMI